MRIIPLSNGSIKLGPQTFHSAPLEAPFHKARQTGFGAVEVFFDKVRGNGFHPADILPPTRQEIKRSGMEMTVHAPIADFGAAGWQRLIEDSIGFCNDTDARILTIHPPLKEDAPSLSVLAGICRQNTGNTVISLENTVYISSPEEISSIAANFSNITGIECGITFDTGHANVNPLRASGFLRRLSWPVRHLHLHDNDGSRDAHLSPGRGNINFGELFHILGDRGFSGAGILEYWRPDEFERDADFLRNANCTN